MIQLAIVTVSDSAVAGTRQDRSGPKLRERAEALGWIVEVQELVPDETSQISAVLRRLADSGRFSVILTTGGTGVALRDVTPEATRAVIEREIPGVAEVMRAEGSKFTPLAALSRALAGVRGRTVIINLPGSPKGAVESLDVISKLVPHMVDLLEGRTGHADVPH
ncbi:MAG TPA: MogA/MoaB family molybdenum cofactor biosynthesis protein [Bryobacteraceae bacterium]|jgi:molybdopterin adenylyltransferase|nr:MogA/MoaB family molybdenum cofactor biosynthesis protein [Bryobacteraceae bacterium]